MMAERRIDGGLRLADLTALAEGAAVINLEIKPLAKRIERAYPDILQKIEDPEIIEMLKNTDEALFLNLAAVCWGFGTTHEELEETGTLIPAILLYKAVADAWDDLYDLLIKNGFEGVDPVIMLNDPAVQKYFDKAYDLMLLDDSSYGTPVMFNKVAEEYVMAEAELTDCSWMAGLSEEEILAKVCEIRSRSFGQYAVALTQYVGKALGRRNGEIEEVASRMFNFAILGGIHDASKDIKEDGGLASCAANFSKTTLLKFEAQLIRGILH